MKKCYRVFNIIICLLLIVFCFNTVVYADSLNCNSWGDVRTDLQKVFNFAKILLPLLIVGLSTFDFIKAVTGKDSKDMKKAFQRLIKRLILALIFFFLPSLINLLLDLFNINGETCIN